MIDYTWDQMGTIYGEYLLERKENLINNFDPEAIWIFMEFCLVVALTEPSTTGTFSLTSPLFTALIPTSWGVSLSIF